MEIFKVKKLNDLATLPTRGRTKSAAYDLYSTEDYTLRPMERKLFKTGLSIAIPQGMYGRIAPRSGLAFKDGIDVLAGVVDEDYRGDVGVILINFGTTEKQFKVGDRIAQLIFEFYNTLEVIEVKDLDETIRGEGGFGSTDNSSTERTIPITNREEIKPKLQPLTGIKKSTITEKTYESHVDLIDQWKKVGGTIGSSPTSYEKLIKEREKSL